MAATVAPRTRGEKSIVADDALANEMVRFLEQEQDRTGATDTEFAESLGIHRNYWRQVKQPDSRWKPGPSFLNGVKSAYPQWAERIRAMIRPEIAALLD